MPSPPSGQSTGATTGEPLIPSPTPGNKPAAMMPPFAGQPSRNTDELHFEPSHLNPPVAHDDGSDEQPPALIAYTRPLANVNRPEAPTTPSEAVFTPLAFSSPSLPAPARYSSFVPTMMLGGLPGPSSWATAGVSTILPWSSDLSWLAGTFALKRGWLLVASIEASLSGSSTSTGKPLTASPPGCP